MSARYSSTGWKVRQALITFIIAMDKRRQKDTKNIIQNRSDIYDRAVKNIARIYNTARKCKRPTIKELNAILSGPPGNIIVNKDGSLKVSHIHKHANINLTISDLEKYAESNTCEILPNGRIRRKQ